MALTKPDHRIGNLIGAVSQTGGLPTGAVIERGSNSNGEYVKFADGTLICTVRVALNDFQHSRFLSRTWTFPATYTSPPKVASYADLDTAYDMGAGAPYDGLNLSSANPLATSITLCAIRSTAGFSIGNYIDVDAFAFGRWF